MPAAQQLFIVLNEERIDRGLAPILYMSAQLNAEAQEHGRELEGRCTDLERRLTDALAELEAVTKAERRAVRETRQLKDQVARQAAQLDELKTSQT